MQELTFDTTLLKTVLGGDKVSGDGLYCLNSKLLSLH